MVPDYVARAADVCQSLAPLIMLTAYLPQWRKLATSRSVEGISIGAWLIWGLAALFSIFYAVVQLLRNGQGWPLVASTSIGGLFILITLLLILRVHRRTAADSSVTG